MVHIYLNSVVVDVAKYILYKNISYFNLIAYYFCLYEVLFDNGVFSNVFLEKDITFQEFVWYKFLITRGRLYGPK